MRNVDEGIKGDGIAVFVVLMVWFRGFAAGFESFCKRRGMGSWTVG